MKKFKYLVVFILTAVIASCSKSDDERNDVLYVDINEGFYYYNHINHEDFPDDRQSQMGTDHLSKVTRCYCGFKRNTEDFYIWLCDSFNIVGKIIINIPMQITEDQGFGNIVTCDLIGTPQPFFLCRVKNLELYYLNLSYNNSKNDYSYLLLLNGEKLSAQKYKGRIYRDKKDIIEWYNNSILYRDESGDYYILSDNGNLISVFDSSLVRPSYYLFTNGKVIPLSYNSYITVANEVDRHGKYQNELIIEILSLDKDDYISFNFQSPFNTTEDFIVNTASLLESTDSYYLLECQLISYSGEKKTVKIKIVPKENSAKIVD